MSILTEEEMRKIAGPRVDYFDHGVFARAIESAVLAKLAGMELPEATIIVDMDLCENQMYDIGDLHQAFAQGAASVLSAEPAGEMSAGTFIHWRDENVPLAGTPIYTLKLSK